VSIYFWADTHFNHRGILKYTSRPYKDIYEMNSELIARWNSAVLRESDEVWLLGDFAFTHAEAEDLGQIFWRLRGRKHLVVGNHDERNPQVLRLPWEKIEKMHTFKSKGQRAELCHYPLETWKASWRGALMLHGHCHGTLKRKISRRFDVGCDVEHLPVEWGDILARGLAEGFQPVDGHGEEPILPETLKELNEEDQDGS
jgi:calcineurin-like phosphoesterase family protein